MTNPQRQVLVRGGGITVTRPEETALYVDPAGAPLRVEHFHLVSTALTPRWTRRRRLQRLAPLAAKVHALNAVWRHLGVTDAHKENE